MNEFYEYLDFTCDDVFTIRSVYERLLEKT